MPTIPVKWYSSQMGGVPDAGGASWPTTAGVSVGLLDAILVDGFGLVTLDSLTVSSGIATATRSAGVTFLIHQVIEIAGATPSGLNGQWRVASVDAGTKTFTFNVTGVSDGAASGTITCKTPGLGWERPFSSGHVRVYRSPHQDSPRSYYRLDDNVSGWNGGALIPYESMTDIDTGFNSWRVSADYTVIPRVKPPSQGGQWFFVGDDRTWYGIGQVKNSTYEWGAIPFGFGDYVSLRPNDQKNEFAAPIFNPNNGAAFLHNNWWALGGASSTYEAHSKWMHDDAYGQLAKVGDPCRLLNDHSGYGGPTFPASPDNGLFVSEHWIREKSTGTPIRGKLRGSYWVLANQPYAQNVLPTFLEGVVGLDGRLCSVNYIQVANASTWFNGRVLFDLTGPW